MNHTPPPPPTDEAVYALGPAGPWGPAAGDTRPYSLQPQAQPAPPNPLIYLDIWLFGGLVLLVMLVVGVKYLWKFFQPDTRDPMDGLQPWEDPDFVGDDDVEER